MGFSQTWSISGIYPGSIIMPTIYINDPDWTDVSVSVASHINSVSISQCQTCENNSLECSDCQLNTSFWYISRYECGVLVRYLDEHMCTVCTVRMHNILHFIKTCKEF